jgi:flavin reductase (DIM6/NTAB) family NADH-FMN oxidoreductase RutF
MHTVIDPKILYLGTPVVLISTLNLDGSANLAPMSSAWWLDLTGVLGLGTRSYTFANLRRERECVLNLPSVDLAAAVDRLALPTGANPVLAWKAAMGYRYVRDKFREAGLTAVASEVVRPPRALECPIQLEASVRAIYSVGDATDFSACVEVKIVRVHVAEELLDSEFRHHISPDRWRPLIMNFLSFYGLGEQVHPSRLAEVF